MAQYPSSSAAAVAEPITDPEALRDRSGVAFAEETRTHEAPDQVAQDDYGQAVAGVLNEDEQLLLLVNREHGVALLPHGPVDSAGDWNAAARDAIEGQTGFAAELDGIAAVRRIEHFADDTDAPLATTHRVVFTASPVGGAIQECKRDAEAGSDRWVAGWYDGLPADVTFPGDGAGEDLRLFLA